MKRLTQNLFLQMMHEPLYVNRHIINPYNCPASSEAGQIQEVTRQSVATTISSTPVPASSRPSTIRTSGSNRSRQRGSDYAGAFWSPDWVGGVTEAPVGRHCERLAANEIAEIEKRCADFAKLFRYW